MDGSRGRADDVKYLHYAPRAEDARLVAEAFRSSPSVAVQPPLNS
jgi:hypothetical protein